MRNQPNNDYKNYQITLKILLAHPGTQYSFQLARQLYKENLLYEFHTGFSFGKDSWVYKLCRKFPSSIYNKLSNRFIDDIPDRLLRRHSTIEVLAMVKLKMGMQEEEVLYKRNKRFQQTIPGSSILEADLIIGFDTSSWILAERCKQSGKKFILDISIGHPLSKEKIYANLSRQYPEWKEQTAPKKKEFIDLECKEMELADVIVVPSEFVKQTLVENSVARDKIKVNPFGTFVEEFRYNPEIKSVKDKITFLFLGSFLARKGLPLLLEVWEEMNIPNAELIIAGYGKIPSAITLPSNVHNKGIIAKGNRQSLFDSAHVFLFPSFFEGLAQVQIEAMACGLPVVGTINSGAFEIVDESLNGFIIEAGNKKQLKEAITFFMNSPAQINIMAKNARDKSEQFSWDAYGKRWCAIIRLVSNGK